MRNILLALFLTGIPLAWYLAWGQTPRIGENAAKKKPDNSAGTNSAAQPRGTKENPLVVDALGHQQTPVERKEAEKQAAEAEAEKQYHYGIDRWTLKWNGIASIATAVLVLIGIGGVCAAIRTLRAIEDQGKHMERQGALMERQLQLQEAAMTQWVLFSNWKDTVISRQGPLAPATKELGIEFEIANPSNYPLTLTGVFNFNGTLPGAPKLTVPGLWIAPTKSGSLSTKVLLTDEQERSYGAEGARISLHGEYAHIGVAKQWSPMMEIHANIICRSGHPTVVEYESIYEKRDQKPEGQGQNPI
jgi:hypothetical protein